MAGSDDFDGALIARFCRENLHPTVERLAEEQETTLSELATQIGYGGVSGLSAALKGRTDLPLSKLLRLAALLDVWSVEELFGRSATSKVLEDLRGS